MWIPQDYVLSLVLLINKFSNLGLRGPRGSKICGRKLLSLMKAIDSCEESKHLMNEYNAGMTTVHGQAIKTSAKNACLYNL